MKPAARCLAGGLALLAVSVAIAQPESIGASPEAGSVETASSGESKACLTHAGQTFALAQSRPGDRLSTDEYTLPGETLGDWTQLITVQRITGSSPASPSHLLQFFRARLKADEAGLEVLAETERANAFAVRFPARGTSDEQVMLCLAFVDPARRQVLNVVQYAVKPHRTGTEIAATQLRAWRDRLVGQTVSP